MQNKLDNIRLFFPVEVTAAYVGLQGLLEMQSIGESEYTFEMIVIIFILVGINAWIYLQFRGLKSIAWHLLIALGFIIWTINIDMPRFEDVPLLGSRIEFYAPVALVFYSLITNFLKLPLPD